MNDDLRVTTAPDTLTTPACPQCGEPIAREDVFCEACGHELPPPPAGAEHGGPPGKGHDGREGHGGAAPGACASCGAEGQITSDGYCGVCGTKQPAARDHEELVVAGGAAVTDRGKRHARNEDAVAVARRGDGRLVAVVCDGVSTTVDPDEASAAATTAAVAALLAADLDDAGAAGDPVADSLLAAHVAARDAVHGLAFMPDAELGAPSCTFLAAVVTPPGVVHLAGLGDCRAYWLDEAAGAGTMLTADDSWAADQVAAGAMSADEADADPRAHMLTRWIGLDADPAWRPTPSRSEPGAGRLLLCSDGLWNYAATAEQILAAARGDDTSALATARRLVRFANDQGGRDNVTVVTVDLPVPATDTRTET